MSNEFTTSERDELLERVQKAERIAEEARIEAAVYREQIIECQRLAERAVRENHRDFMHGVVSKADITLKENNVTSWAKSWREAWISDLSWLKMTLKSLKRIKKLIEQAKIDKDSPHFALTQNILSAAKTALHQHISSSISLDDIKE